MTLQLRLTLTFFVLSAVALTVLGAGAYLITSARTYESVDQSLSAWAEAIGASIGFSEALGGSVDVGSSRRSLDAQAAQGARFAVLDLQGTVLYSSMSSGDVRSHGVLGGAERIFSTLDVGGGRERLIAEPILLASQPRGYVEVVTSLEQADSSLTQMRSALIAGGAVVSLLTALAAFYLAGRAVQPVNDVAMLAREIELTADFSRRLPAVRSAREMRLMAETFNRMIERVDRVLRSQRSFLSDTSHELRRPLTVLRTDIDVINDPRLSDEERETVGKEMAEVADSMGHLLSELLQLSRQEEELLPLRATDFSSLCQRAVKVTSLAYPQHRYQGEITDNVWTEGDAERLTRAVENLLQNAALYTEGSGTITCTLATCDGTAVLNIADTGSGMSSEDVEHAFDRFYRGAGSRRVRPDGLGLGLAIVKQVVDRHGGAVKIESELGRGTSVTVKVPLSF